MIALFLLQAAVAAAPAPPVPGPLPQQALPVRGCAAYLWSVADRRLAAMAAAEPGSLRLAIDGKPVDLARVEQAGVASFGFTETATYRRGNISATLTLQIAIRADLADGATVPVASLSIARGAGDALVMPVAGLIGCAKAVSQ